VQTIPAPAGATLRRRDATHEFDTLGVKLPLFLDIVASALERFQQLGVRRQELLLRRRRGHRSSRSTFPCWL
jgi:hypothetical protein